MIVTCVKLFIAFFKAGLFGWGGGAALIPLIERECVIRNAWLTAEKFGELIAVSNSVPGVLAVKMAAYIGYKEAGILGLLSSIVAIILPGIILLFFIYGFLIRKQDSPLVQKIIMGIKCGAAGFIAYSVFRVFPADQVTRTTLILSVLLTTSVVIALRYQLDPIITIILAALMGLVLF
jgi:chromate transporter